ncbi:MAG: DUF86 domain-containing protein [Calditrichota bacterium]
MSDDKAYIEHIAEAIRKIEEYTAVGRDVFIEQTHWQDAVIRKLEIIGEAAKRLSSEIKRQHTDIEWRRIAGLRDVLIHDYMGVDINAVWDIAANDIPNLKREINEILTWL